MCERRWGVPDCWEAAVLTGGGSCWVPVRAAVFRRPERRRGRGGVQPSPLSDPSFHPRMHITCVVFTAGWRRRRRRRSGLSARRCRLEGRVLRVQHRSRRTGEAGAYTGFPSADAGGGSPLSVSPPTPHATRADSSSVRARDD